MALIKLSAIGITAISGKSGGSVFAFNRGGKYVRSWAKPTNPQTNKQTMMRSIFGFVSQLWGQLDEGQVSAWNQAGREQSRTNKVGDTHTMNGFSYFKAVNQNRLHSGWETPLLTPPVKLQIPAVIGTEFDLGEALGIVTGSLDFKLGDAVVANDYVASIGFAVVPAGQNRDYGSVKNSFKNRIRIPVPAGTQINVGANAIVGATGPLQVGDRVYIQMHIHSADGQKGTEVTATTKVVEEE